MLRNSHTVSAIMEAIEKRKDDHTMQEQISIVKKALDLSIFIADTKEKLERYRSESFQSRPMPPQRETITPVYPEIKPSVSFWSPLLLLTVFFLPFPILYYVFVFLPKKEKEIEKIRNSDEYRRECAAIDENVRIRQKEADDAYAAAMKEYNDVTIPQYEDEKIRWEKEHSANINSAESDLEAAEKELAELYETTKIIPLQYRDMDALQYIYDTISTSDYTVHDAIEIYDKARQRLLEEERLHELQAANRLADEQNSLLDRQNEIAERARRDASRAAIVSAIQHHNTNKILKNNLENKKR